MTATQPWATTVEQAPVARGNAPATAGFRLGLVGLVAGFVPILGLLVTVPAVVLSHAGRARFRSGRAAGPGRSTAGTVLGWTGSAICVLMSVLAIVAAANAPVQAVQPVAAAPAPVAPALLSVPNVVGMDDRQARDVLGAAGFTNVVLGPSTGSIAGVAAGTVTTQLPAVAALATAGDPIVLGEAAAPPAPPAPVVAPQSAPTTAAAPATQAPALVAEPDTDVDRPYVPAAPQPLVSSGSGGSSGSSAYYANCSAARSAGAAPLYRGDAGYSSKLDRDGDGVACE
jgi:hypothetical protein